MGRPADDKGDDHTARRGAHASIATGTGHGRPTRTTGRRVRTAVTAAIVFNLAAGTSAVVVRAGGQPEAARPAASRDSTPSTSASETTTQAPFAVGDDRDEAAGGPHRVETTRPPRGRGSRTTSSGSGEPASVERGAVHSTAGVPAGRIVFGTTDDGEDWRLHTVRPDGSDLRLVTEGAAPQWSPDGSRIVFVDREMHVRSVVNVVNADGSGRTPVTPADVFAGYPAWSPDGTLIAYVATRSPNPALFYGPPFVGVGGYDTDISVVTADGLVTRPVTTQPGVELMPSWSAEGSRIAFLRYQLGRSRVDSVAVDGTSPREHGQGTTTGYHSGVAWSPVAPLIAFTQMGDAPSGHNSAVWLTHADRDDARPLHATNAEAFSPAWSPDGTAVAFSLGPTEQDSEETIHVVTLDGATSAPFPGVQPTFSPDGAYVAYCRQDAGRGLWRANRDGSNPVHLFGGWCDSPDWEVVPG